MLTTPTVVNCVCLNEKRDIWQSKSCSIKKAKQAKPLFMQMQMFLSCAKLEKTVSSSKTLEAII